ncbi:MAG: ATP-binding protein [Dysgonamonadaceae bacterium]
MFKSIEYKLGILSVVLVGSVSLSTYFLLHAEYVWGGIGGILVCAILWNMYKGYSKFNQNILFLLNALENGDYSFRFSEDRLSPREKEFNSTMNRIKDILTEARKTVIENEKFLSIILENVSTGILIVNESGVVIHGNHSVRQLLGMPVITHLKQLKIINETYPELFLGMKTQDSLSIKVPNEREEMQLNVRCSMVNVHNSVLKILLVNNIGNELEMREMESWIKLIRVMTHEIMNSIAPITSLSETILFSYKMQENGNRQDELTQNTLEALQTIHATAKGLIGFVNSYRRFTGIPQPQKINISLNALVENIILLEDETLKTKGIHLEVLSEEKETLIEADESQISQVLTNLVRNAIEAVAETENASIKIKIIQKNDKTELSVANNGPAIPPEILPHIFIPFFTTKDSGSGIGLSLSRYIMRLHGGNLRYYSENEWVVFCLLF